MNNQKIAWVTGGRGGIGSAVVKALKNMGYSVNTVGKHYKNDVGVDLIFKESVRYIS